MAKMGVAPADRYKVKLECLRLLATLHLDPAKTHFISGFIDTYLRLSRDELQLFRAELETILPVEREDVMEIVTSWMEDGIQEGEQRVVTRQLTRRFGVLPDDFQARIGVLSIAQLDQLGEALLDFGTIADLTSWLDQYARTEGTP